MPDVIKNPVLSSDRSRGDRILQWFDPTAFAMPALGAYGITGRNALIGPNSINTNLALFKNFPLPICEGMRLQFRSEFSIC